MSSEFENLVQPPLPHETFARKPTWDDIRAYVKALQLLREQFEGSSSPSGSGGEDKDKEIINLRAEVGRLNRIIEQAREQVTRLQERNKETIAEKEELRRQFEQNYNTFVAPLVNDSDPEEDTIWEKELGGTETRKVSKDGKISFQKKKYSVGKEWKGQQVEIVHTNGAISVLLPNGTTTLIEVRS